MNREFFLDLDSSRAQRAVSVAERPIEVRTSDKGDTLIWDGYASVTGHSFPVFGGPPYGWNETVQRGAFKRTLLNNADVSFLIGHEGMSLARTRSGTLTLMEDEVGLRNVAELDLRQNAVRDLAIANERGDVNEQSIGFRIVGDEWFDADGEPSDRMRGTERTITEINMNKGDVSAVNYGANDAAGGGFRELDVALSELRHGKALTDTQRALIRSFAAAIEETTPPEPEAPRIIKARLALLEVV